ncbi:gliding motility protein GldL [Paludibacter sp. 221]|uniref:type IX secretion system motor protein PorL/GldL n=1 Tax=Paludibacter sp. 221 TaxID=2302939 RepID=UPI0013CFB91D|nr:gliding motility protein GldL [Paludibacter sp. 221]NDV46346.1 gliding motility protein GldL [Paludibacter sp. 221]
MSSKNKSKFDIWWNSQGVKRASGAIYSIGAAVVITGALFKLMHWPYAGLILSAGMITEALLFILSAFDSPHKDYEWDRIFSFEGDGTTFNEINIGGGSRTPSFGTQQLADEELKNLSDGIKNLSETAKQLNTISDAVGSTKEYIKNIESASEVTAKFASTQTSLNSATTSLFASYESLNKDMDSAVNSTKQYAEATKDINKNLSSLNSIYEIQLKNIQSQSAAIEKQTEGARLVAESLNDIASENKKIKQLTQTTFDEVNQYKEASAQLTSHIKELNRIYGNMLNALS